MLHLDPQRTQDILWANTQNQFILGSSLLVAPVTEKGARSRTVIFPEGTWVGDDGSRVVGPVTIKIDVPLERLPYYRLQSDS
jgi:alpha-glucosidase (family GH31 glycosyl hydrolase)